MAVSANGEMYRVYLNTLSMWLIEQTMWYQLKPYRFTQLFQPTNIAVMFRIWHTLHTIHYTLHTIHYTLYTIHYTLYTIHYTLHTIHYTLHTIHYTLYNISIGGQGFDWHLLAFVHSLHASQYCACVVHFLLGSAGQSVKTKVSNFWQNISAKYDQRVCHETK